MSEHDEPKTALTRLLGEHGGFTTALGRYVRGGWSWRCWCGHEESWDAADDAPDAHLAHLADVLLAEGCTTSPAPEATETVEWEYGVAWWWIGGDGHHASATVPSDSEAAAHERVAGMFNAHVVRRPKPDEWVPVDRVADEHEEGGQ